MTSKQSIIKELFRSMPKQYKALLIAELLEEYLVVSNLEDKYWLSVLNNLKRWSFDE